MVYVPKWACVRPQSLAYWAAQLDREGVRDKLKLTRHEMRLMEERLGVPKYADPAASADAAPAAETPALMRPNPRGWGGAG